MAIPLTWPTSSKQWNSFLEASQLDPVVAELALRLAWRARKQLGLDLQISSAYRSPQAQAALRARWDRGDRKGLKVRPAEDSMHEKGRAFDVDAIGPEPAQTQWAALGRLGESLGLRWGGRFQDPDPIHFDR